MGHQVLITVDLGHGDSGKGTIVDALVRKHDAGMVVRFNGGAQAAHNVIDPEGRHHTFRQFGSGSFIPGVKTLLSRFMLVDPTAMAIEGAQLNSLGVYNLFKRMYVDERAAIVTPYHKALNRLREFSRGAARHGSCGMGIGETVQLSEEFPDLTIRAGDLLNPDGLAFKMAKLYAIITERAAALKIEGDAKPVEKDLAVFSIPVRNVVRLFTEFAKEINIATPDNVAELLRTRTSVFEAAQGVLLDQDFGFHPYTTWSKTTSTNAYTILTEAGIDHPTTEIGILRAFSTRHGPGPFVTEHEPLRSVLRNEHNKYNDWQREFRVGWLDLPMLRYALMVNGPVHCLAVTHVDCLDTLEKWTVCETYEDSLPVPDSLVAQAKLTVKLANMRFASITVSKDHVLGIIRSALKTPVGIVSRGPTSDDKVFSATPELVST